MTESPKFVLNQLLSTEKFRQVCLFWEQIQEQFSSEIYLISDATIHLASPSTEEFRLLLSAEVNALLLGEAKADSLYYQVRISFDAQIIQDFIIQLEQQGLETTQIREYFLNTTTSNSIQQNLQSYLLLKLWEIVAPLQDTELTVCQPAEDALYYQIEQERLLNQVITQIRQSLDLNMVLETAVREVRKFLEVDRLLVYQFIEDLFPNTPIESHQGQGKITYEARSHANISSVLNMVAEGECFSYIPDYQEKYRRGEIIAVEDVETIYNSSFCLSELLYNHQVKSKLIAPIVVEGKLWGLLISHQCSYKRQWQEIEKKFLGHIGEHLAVAIYQAELYGQVQEQKNLFEQRVIERTRELQESLLIAEAANQYKSEFLSNMSHELMTPLTCIIGLSETLQRYSSETVSLPLERRQRYLKTIQSNGKKLQGLIDDIINFSQISAGKVILDIKEFSIRFLCQMAIQSIAGEAQEKQIETQLEFQVRDSENSFWADPDKLQQSLLHLLRNAIKFTPERGRVILRVWRENQRLILQVEDTGIGIPAEYIPFLFDRFRQLEQSRQRTYEGVGLGLALTRQLVELHQGIIEVESTVGQGSLFTICIPNQYYKRRQKNLTNATANIPDISNRTIVLLEQDEETATLISDLLIASNYQIIWLLDDDLADKKIEVIQPSLVILAQDMENFDRIRRKITKLAQNKRTKILLLGTMLNLSSDYRQELGVNDYLLKPIQADLFLKKIRDLLLTSP